jgi:hypothetical protein
VSDKGDPFVSRGALDVGQCRREVKAPVVVESPPHPQTTPVAGLLVTAMPAKIEAPHIETALLEVGRKGPFRCEVPVVCAGTKTMNQENGRA